MDNNQNAKKSFWKDFRNIIIIILLILLIIVGVLYFQKLNVQNEFYALQSQIENLTASNTELASKIEENNSKITELENKNNILQTEKESIEADKKQLENDKAELTSQIEKIKKTTTSNKTTSTNDSSPVSSAEVGIWTTVIANGEKSYTTTYEFKNNGDFYVNGNNVGTYKDGSIFFKDSNDPNYRTALYKFNNNILYVNLYQNSTDICVSTDFYECTKN